MADQVEDVVEERRRRRGRRGRVEGGSAGASRPKRAGLTGVWTNEMRALALGPDRPEASNSGARGEGGALSCFCAPLPRCLSTLHPQCPPHFQTVISWTSEGHELSTDRYTIPDCGQPGVYVLRTPCALTLPHKPPVYTIISLEQFMTCPSYMYDGQPWWRFETTLSTTAARPL